MAKTRLTYNKSKCIIVKRGNMDIKTLIIPGLTAFILNMILTPVIIKVSLKKGWYDHTNERKIHSGDISRLGGVGIFLSFLISFALFYFVLDYKSLDVKSLNLTNWKLFGFLFSLTAIFITGLIDDFSNIKARYKLFIQIAVSLSLVMTGFIFKTIAIPFTSVIIELSYFGYPLSFLWFIGIINAVNLIDGMDGLSGGTSFISLLFLGLIGYVTGNMFMTYISFILMSSLLAFLIFNFPPAKLFMGDSGSLFLGTSLAIFPFLGTFSDSYSWVNDSLIFIVLLLYIVPIFDTFSAIIRRSIIKRVHFFNPDKEHLHHKLLNLNLSTKKTLFIIYSLSAIGGISAFIFINVNLFYRNIILVATFTLLFLIFLILTLLHNKNKLNK